MEGLFTLIVLCAVMAAMSFLVGSLPLSLTLSSSQLRFVSALGMGVLVGTSLVVIIPEGVETLYSSVTVAHTTNAPLTVRGTAGEIVAHLRIPRAIVNLNNREIPGFLLQRDENSVAEETGKGKGDFNAAVIPGSGSPHDPVQPADVKDGEVRILGTAPGEKVTNSVEKGKQPTSQEDHQEKGNEKENETQTETHAGHGTSPHAWIGVALLSGFILMYLIDKVPHYTSFGFSRRTPPRPHHISLDNLSSALPSPITNGHVDIPFVGHSGSSTPMATTTGLAIHAAADGIALGSSSSASNTKLSFIIFVAIILHKAPAAFGLSTVLLQQGLSKRGVRAHLLIFSLAAPAGAVLTWILAHTLFSSSISSSSSLLSSSSSTAAAAASTTLTAAEHEANVHWRTGMLLLFSAGTFLYVAMHTMQDITGSSGAHTASSPGSHTQLNALFDGHDMSGVSSANARGLGSKHEVRDLIVSVVGMILPLFLQIGHAH
ncbi:hypothetical protein KEM54_000532 [Ascosphaera aggregata]|nr:hypothetical protein KEM54_000532 [Ascosphaera aggregata]